MRATVHYLAQLKRATGRGSEQIELAGDAVTLRELLHALGTRHGTQVQALLLTPEGTPQPSLLFFVDEQQAAPESPVADGSEVVILAPMAGG